MIRRRLCRSRSHTTLQSRLRVLLPLSTSSQALHDIPLPEVYRRIDMIRDTYGPGVDVQITGGEPTLRSADDLEAIVRYVHSAGLRSTLMTNGIRASRTLLQGLASAGLSDVAFHVDMTQARKGYDSEAALDAIRLAYIERVRGLGLTVMFNTTLDERNSPALPALVRFFITHAHVVRFASFQIGTHTGRGVGVAPRNIGIDDVETAIAGAAATALRFDAVGSGHRRCNRYACALVINGQVHDAFENIVQLRRPCWTPPLFGHSIGAGRACAALPACRGAGPALVGVSHAVGAEENLVSAAGSPCRTRSGWTSCRFLFTPSCLPMVWMLNASRPARSWS